MKIITTLLLLFLTVALSAQIAPTTQEEYNYVTKGYKVQQESGLDMKKGYSIKFYQETEITGKVDLFTEGEAIAGGLFRDGESKPCAIIIIYQNKSIKAKHYMCVPSYNADKKLWDSHLSYVFNVLGEEARKLVYKCSNATSNFLIPD